MIFLYVKQHSVTGLKYFGKTTKKDPYKYTGSGKYWKRHIKTHGKEHIQTLWVQQFDSLEKCSEFALHFSLDNNITESSEWANLKPENGYDGGSLKGRRGTNFKGPPPMLGTIAARKVNLGRKRIFSEEHKKNIASSRQGQPRSKHSDLTRQKISIALKGRSFSPESLAKMSQAKKGKPAWNKGLTGLQGAPGKRLKCSCIKCKRELSVNNLNTHFQRCQPT